MRKCRLPGIWVVVAFCAQLAWGAGPAASPNWVTSWAAAQQVPETRNALPTDALRNATLRQVVHLSLGGNLLRVRLSNAFGTAPLHFTSVHIARSVATVSDFLTVGFS